MISNRRTIAVFDFDGTLVKSDSFFPFLGFLAGWHRLALAFLGTAADYIVRKLKNSHDPAITDYRTFFKAALLRKLVTGRSIDELPAVREKLLLWRRWIPEMKEKLRNHHAQGHHIVVASGGLDLYLHDLLKDIPVDGFVCTHIGVEDGKMTGVMVSGNCVRERKAELLADYLAANGPFEESWGYGNLPHDLPMLELLQHRLIV